MRSIFWGDLGLSRIDFSKGDADADQVDEKGLVYFIEQWFTDHGYPPNRGSGTADGLTSSTKTKTFKHIKRSFEKNAFVNVKDFSIMHTLAGGFDGSDYIFLGDYCKDWISFMFDDNQYLFNSIHIIQFIHELTSYVKPKYGYAYQREFYLGPYCYNMGIIYGNEYTDAEENLINKWFYHYGVDRCYETGQFRDIYPYDLISEKHLELEIDGKALADWISTDSRHGTLNQLNENLWIWHVSEENIPLVREALRPTGQLICI